MPMSYVLPICLEEAVDVLEKLRDFQSEAVPLAAVALKNDGEFVHYRLRWPDVEKVMEDVWTLSKSSDVKSWLKENAPLSVVLDWTLVFFMTPKARDGFFDELIAAMTTA